MSKRRMRSAAREKLNQALEAAAQKEGREITDTLISASEFERMKKNRDLVVFDGINEWLLADGRYIQTREDVESGTMHYHIIDNLPVKTIEALVLGKREEVIDKRNYEDNEDGRYIAYQRKEAECTTPEEYSALVNPVDQLQAEKYFRVGDADGDGTDDIDYYHGSPEQIVLKQMGFGRKQYHSFDYPTVDLETLSTHPVITYTNYGTFDDKTSFRMKQLITTWYQNLKPKTQDAVRLLFDRNLSQKEAAEILGVSPQAVSKRKKALIERAADFLAAYGYPAKEVMRTFTENAEAVQKEMKSVYLSKDLRSSEVQ